MPPPTFFFASRTADRFYDVLTCRFLCDQATDEQLDQVYNKLADPQWGGISSLLRGHFVRGHDYVSSRALSAPLYLNSANARRYGIAGPYHRLNTAHILFSLDVREGNWAQSLEDETAVRRLIAPIEPPWQKSQPFDDLDIIRTKEMVLMADVFSLQIDDGSPPDMLAIAHFGTALSHNKLCVIYFVGMRSATRTRPYHSLILQSLQSFNKVTLARANEVVTAHPRLPYDYYSEYDIYLRELLTFAGIDYFEPVDSATALGLRCRTDNHDQLRNTLWEWRRIASEAIHHPDRKRKRGEFDSENV